MNPYLPPLGLALFSAALVFTAYRIVQRRTSIDGVVSTVLPKALRRQLAELDPNSAAAEVFVELLHHISTASPRLVRLEVLASSATGTELRLRFSDSTVLLCRIRPEQLADLTLIATRTPQTKVLVVGEGVPADVAFVAADETVIVQLTPLG